MYLHLHSINSSSDVGFLVQTKDGSMDGLEIAAWSSAEKDCKAVFDSTLLSLTQIEMLEDRYEEMILKRDDSVQWLDFAQLP